MCRSSGEEQAKGKGMEKKIITIKGPRLRAAEKQTWKTRRADERVAKKSFTANVGNDTFRRGVPTGAYNCTRSQYRFPFFSGFYLLLFFFFFNAQCNGPTVRVTVTFSHEQIRRYHQRGSPADNFRCFGDRATREPCHARKSHGFPWEISLTGGKRERKGKRPGRSFPDVYHKG